MELGLAGHMIPSMMNTIGYAAINITPLQRSGARSVFAIARSGSQERPLGLGAFIRIMRVRYAPAQINSGGRA
jgi:hypothetical protein